MQTRSHFHLATAVRWYRRYQGYQGYQGYRYNSHAVITHRPATGLSLLFVLPVPPVTPVPPLLRSSLGSRRQLASTSPFVLPVPPVPPVASLSGRNAPWA